MTSALREWLQGKQKRGVSQVRVATVLSELDAQEQAQEQATANGGARRRKQLDLVGTAEAAEDILGVERPRIGRWLDRCRHCGAKQMKGEWDPEDPNFIPCKSRRGHQSVMPEPVARLRSGPVWYRSQIVGFKEEREKRRRK